MLELLRYFPAILLDLTWELKSQLEIERTHGGPHNVTVRSNGPLAVKLINNSAFPGSVQVQVTLARWDRIF